jgi:hypothetical protein
MSLPFTMDGARRHRLHELLAHHNADEPAFVVGMAFPQVK